MRDSHTTPVEARFNLDIPMPHVHMTIPEMMSMGQAPDVYGLDEDDDLQLVYFGNTTHAIYNPITREYTLTIGNGEFSFRGIYVCKMCNMIKEYLDDEGMLVSHLNRFTWEWANTVANNIDEDRFFAEVSFLFEKDGNVIDNMAGEGDDMFQFHVNDYQVFGLRTPEDTYRVIEWVDGESETVGHFETMAQCHTAIKMRQTDKALRKHALDASTLIIEMMNERLKK